MNPQITTSPAILAAMWAAMTSPKRENAPRAAKAVASIVADGAAPGYRIDDLLGDLGLGWGARLTAQDLFQVLSTPVRNIYVRPRGGQKSVFGSPEVLACDLAALLIGLERLGFPIDPRPMINAMLPKLRKQDRVNDAELHILWYREERHRLCEVTVTAIDGPKLIDSQQAMTLPSGYHAVACFAQDGSPVRITVTPPERRAAKEPAALAQGDIVRVRAGGAVPRGSLGTVVESYGDTTVVMLDSGPCTLARHEIVKHHDQSPLKPPMRFRLPYGIWTCEDGREVLFNRNYRPLAERRPGEPATLASGLEWVRFTDQHWFYDDTTPPWRNKASLARCRKTLAAWGFAGWEGEGLPDAAAFRSSEDYAFAAE